MKKNHWHLLLEPDMKAPVSGIYLFAIRDDNHISYECRKLNEGESFYCAVGTLSTDPTDWFVPIAYHSVKNLFFLTAFLSHRVLQIIHGIHVIVIMTPMA